MKWGVILDIGEDTMKTAVRDLIEKQDARSNQANMERRFITTQIEARATDEQTARTPTD